MKLIIGLLFILGTQCLYADAKIGQPQKHIKQKVLKNNKNYGYKFSGSAIGSSLSHLLKNSNGNVYEGKLKNYNRHLKVIKSNPSATFLELRLFYAHLQTQDQKEKQFVMHLMRQLNHPLSKDFVSSNSFTND